MCKKQEEELVFLNRPGFPPNHLPNCNQDNLNIPVVYFSQLVGLALGLIDQMTGLDRMLIPVDSSRFEAEGRNAEVGMS